MEFLKNLNFKFNFKAFVEILVASAITIVLIVMGFSQGDDYTPLHIKVGVFAFFQPIALMVIVLFVDAITDFEPSIYSFMLCVMKQLLKTLFFCILPAGIIGLGICYLEEKFTILSLSPQAREDFPWYVMAFSFFIWTNIYCYINANKE
jgi:hypothetical protein